MRTKIHAAAVIDRYWCVDASFASAAQGILAHVGAEEIHAAVTKAGDRWEGTPEVINGTAIIPLCGPMTKGETSMSAYFGGCSTVRVRRMIRSAMADKDVERIMLHVDSPGGTVDGTADLGDEIARANAKKPVTAYVDNMCCSAALWAASQAGEIVANPNALAIGSIGTFCVLYDTSKCYEEAGIAVHLISTGDLKGHPTSGVAIPDDVIEDCQEFVQHITDRFVDAVATGRKMSQAGVTKLATGKTWTAEQAQALGLVDRLATMDDLLFPSANVSGTRAETTEHEDDMSFFNKWFKPKTEASEQPSENAAFDLEMAKIASTMAEQFIDGKVAALKNEKKLLPAQESAFREALECAILADGEGAPRLSDGKLFTDATVKAVVAFAESAEPLPLGERTLSSVTDEAIVIAEPDSAAKKQFERGREAMKKATPGTLGKNK